MIVMPNIDSKIWDIELRAVDICYAMMHSQSIDISLNAEGPCCRTLGLYDMLDRLCEKFQYPKSNITILTCNQLETHSEYRIKKMPPLYIPETQKFIQDNQHYFLSKTFNNDFKKFGIFVGRSNHLRLQIAANIYSKYRDQTALTFHYDCNKTFHRDHLGFDDLLKWPHSDRDIDNAVDLIKNSPVLVQDVEESYPMLSPAHLNIAKIYHTFFVEIVCETYFTGNTFYPTEKIWRPIALKTPFIVQGPKDYYNNLRRVGFRTFHQWWDEGFGEDPYDCHAESIFQIIDKINRMTLGELQKMHDEMKPVLEHNYNLLMTLNPTKFKELFHE